MRRHEISYHDDIDSISFKRDHCDHSKSLKSLKTKILISRKSSISLTLKVETSIVRISKLKSFSLKKFVFNSQTILKRSNSIKDFQSTNSTNNTDSTSETCEKFVNLAMISAVVYKMISQQEEIQLFFISLKDVNEHLREFDVKKTNSKTILSKKYLKFLIVFSKAAFDELLSHRDIDHQIVLKEEKQANHNYCLLYNMSKDELVTIKKYLKENLKKNFMIVSFSFFVSSILFAKKSNKKLRFCVDYRKLNVITRKNRYLLSLIDETLIQLLKIKIFIRLDIRQAFHRVRMRKKDEDLTIFRTRFESYKYRVMSFELINESVIYQHYMNNTLFDVLNKFVTTYLDDILFYSQDIKKHRDHVKKVLERLRVANLQVDINKCEFNITETKFLELIVEKNEIRINSEKIRTIVK